MERERERERSSPGQMFVFGNRHRHEESSLINDDDDGMMTRKKKKKKKMICVLLRFSYMCVSTRCDDMMAMICTYGKC